MQQAGASAGRVQELYLALLADARSDSRRPAPGKVTRTMRLEAEQISRQRRGPRPARPSQREHRPVVPGKMTLTSYLAPRDPSLADRSSGNHDEHMAMDAMAELLRRHGLPVPSAQERSRDQALHATLAHRLDDAGPTLDDLPWTVDAMSDDAWADDAAGEEPWSGVEAGETVGVEAEEDLWSEAERAPEHLPEATRARMERAFG